MALAYSQDLRDRVIDAVIGGKMSRRGAAARFGVSLSSAIKWVQRFERTGSHKAARMGRYKPVKMEPHREFLEAVRAEKPDITLKALCDRLLAERRVKVDTSMMSRFFRGIGVTRKKRRPSRASATAHHLPGWGLAWLNLHPEVEIGLDERRSHPERRDGLADGAHRPLRRQPLTG